MTVAVNGASASASTFFEGYHSSTTNCTAIKGVSANTAYALLLNVNSGNYNVQLGKIVLKSGTKTIQTFSGNLATTFNTNGFTLRAAIPRGSYFFFTGAI